MLRTGLMSLALLLLSIPAHALESPPARTSRVTATLISDQDTVQPGKPLQLGLRLRIAPGWHTYWQNPGDAGAPPELNLVLPPGTTAGPLQWPTPTRLPEGPVMTYAYQTEVVLPLTVTPAAGDLVINATATWLVCERICVPEEGSFHLTLPEGAPTPSAQAPLFAAASTRVPGPSPFQARVAPDGSLTLAGPELSPATVQDAWFFPAAWGPIDQAAPQTVTITPGLVRLALRPGTAFKPGAGLDGTVVLRAPGGQETFLAVAATPGPAIAAEAAPFWHTLAFALLGGLILNLMPCVFPVLAMKAVALARLSGQGRGVIQAQAASYTAGVLVAFTGLGALLLVLRGLGRAYGWGFQFQSPVFVAAMAWVMLAVGLNLSGVFHVGGRLAGAGQGLAARPGHAGSFFTGLLAVLVATPCTAPFMGVAIAGALAAPAAVGMAVFLAMGLGLALPYLVFAGVPRLVTLLPRPGLWMEILKQAMAFPIFAACAWLAWVASIEGGSGGLLAVAVGLVLLGTGAWLFGLSQRIASEADGAGGVRSARFSGFLALAFLLATLAMLPGLTRTPEGARQAAGEPGWQDFSDASLASLRAAQRPVLVDMSAAWCVSCLVNERVAFRSDAVQAAFASRRVALLKGDWTLHDAAITRFLAAHDREGVPFYIYYPPGGEGRIWPQILTPNLVLREVTGSAG